MKMKLKELETKLAIARTGMSLEAFAQSIDMASSTLYKAFRRNTNDARTIIRIADGLGMDAKELVEMDD